MGGHFATLLGLPLTMLILGVGGSIDTQLGKSLCNFAGITSDNVDPGKSLCNFAGLPLGGVSIDTLTTWEVNQYSTCKVFAGITSDNDAGVVILGGQC